MPFLQPTAAEKAEIYKRQEVQRIQKKHDATKKAEARKKARDAEKARVAEINGNLETSQPKRKLTVEDQVEKYLNEPPYMGRSDKKDYKRVKELCGSGEGDSLFRYETKRWGTKSIARVAALVKSGLWFPIGLDDEWEPELLAAIDARTQKPKPVAQTTATLQEERRSRDLLLGVPASTVDELAKCDALGLSDLVDTSSGWAELGPRAGVSNAARLVRWVELNSHGLDGDARERAQREVVAELRSRV
jgi:hypothetical protein